MRDCTLCMVLDGERERILLVAKKRGFGQGKMNSAGGKVDPGETVEEGAKREVMEETGLTVKACEKVAELDFYFGQRPEWDQRVHVFLAKEWDGEPRETEEASPSWHPLDRIPYEKMWADDGHWLPLVLEGKKVKAAFNFTGEKGEQILDFKMEEVKGWQ